MGRILKLFNNIKSSKRWRRNSDLYQDVVNTMQSYTEQMDKPVTEESTKKLKDKIINRKKYQNTLKIMIIFCFLWRHEIDTT